MLKKKTILISSAILLLLLSGCGSSSSDNDSKTPETEELNENGNRETETNENSNTNRETNNDDMSNNTTGECVDLPKLQAGLSHTIRTKSLTSGSKVDVQITLTKASSTQLVYDTTSSGDVTATGTKVEDISIHDNYLDISKIVTKDTTTAQGMTIQSDVTLDFSPYLRSVYTRACKGMSWTNDYKLTTTTTVLNRPIAVDSAIKSTSKIEAVNESKTIGLGTYTTMRIKTESKDGTKQITWTDLNEVKTVYSENYDVNGKLVGTQELISD